MRLTLILLLNLVSAHIAADSISFKSDVAPILKSAYASCHLTGTEAGERALYPLVARQNLVNRSSLSSELLLVDPGNPDRSYLMLKLEGTHLDAGEAGVRMPIGAAPLSAKKLDKIRTWILEGALDN